MLVSSVVSLVTRSASLSITVDLSPFLFFVDLFLSLEEGINSEIDFLSSFKRASSLQRFVSPVKIFWR